jgi:predicted permease
VLKAEYTLPATRYPRDFSRWPQWPEVHGFNRAVLERVRTIPGVTAAAIASSHPLNRGFTNSWSIIGIDNGGERLPEISLRQVSPEYFDAMGSKLVAGRGFTEGDGPDQPPVGLINETTARRFFGTHDPIGMEIRFWGINRRIIGVVSDEKIHGLTEATPPAVYVSIWQAPSWNGALLIRTDQAPEALTSQARQAIWSIDRELAVYGMEPLERTLQSSVGQRRFAMLVLVVFAGLTLTLALIGIYGVLSYATEQRTREIGIRAALGAQRGSVAGLVVKQGAVLTAVGIAAGIAGALAGSRLLESLLFGITRLDLLTHVMVPVLVLGAALLAMWVPAWRATRVSPIEALRRE